MVKTARADPSVDLRTFRPGTDRSGTLATESVETPGPWNLQFGSYFSYATPTLKVRESDGSEVTAVSGQLIGDPVFAVGLGRSAALGLTLPMVIAQSGSASSVSEMRPPPSQGIGDLTLTGKAAAIVPDPSMGGLGLAFLSRFSLPTGDRASFVSEAASTAEARILAGYDLGHLLFFNATAGYRLRFAQRVVADVTLGDVIPWGLTLGLKPRGIGLDDQGHWTLMLEGHGEIGAVPNKFLGSSAVSSVLVGGSARYQVDKSFAIFGGVETSATAALGVPRARFVLGITFAPTIVDEDNDGVPDDIDECPGLPEDGRGKFPHDGCPDFDSAINQPQSEAKAVDSDKCLNTAGTAANAGCPNTNPATAPALPASDRDHDGILDDQDQCPDVPETVNGYLDEDGCPESDRDFDTFFDDEDACPDQAENFNGYQDDDGCPDTPPPPPPTAIGNLKPTFSALAVEKQGAGPAASKTLALSRKIGFEGDRVSTESTADLRALAAYGLANPSVTLGVSVKPAIAQVAAGDGSSPLPSARALALAEAIARYAHHKDAATAKPWPSKPPPGSADVLVWVVSSPPTPAKGGPAKSDKP
ncbi:MAG: hypothetical protein NVS3B20_03080 [Polyangiales bacterium]